MRTEMELIRKAAEDCIADLSTEERASLIEHPCVVDYYFSYCPYIKNKYIHVEELEASGIRVHPDDLALKILEMVISILIPEYEYGSPFMRRLYEDEKYISLRKGYYQRYEQYPVKLIEKYKFLAGEERVKAGNDDDQLYEKYSVLIASLLDELKELVLCENI